MSTINMVINAGRKFHEKVYKTVHVRVIFSIAMQFLYQLHCYFILGENFRDYYTQCEKHEISATQKFRCFTASTRSLWLQMRGINLSSVS